MKVKIVMQNGVVMGAFMSHSAKAVGLKVDIVDADSEYDTEAAVQHELDNPDMVEIDETITRHPEC